MPPQAVSLRWSSGLWSERDAESAEASSAASSRWAGLIRAVSRVSSSSSPLAWSSRGAAVELRWL